MEKYIHFWAYWLAESESMIKYYGGLSINDYRVKKNISKYEKLKSFSIKRLTIACNNLENE